MLREDSTRRDREGEICYADSLIYYFIYLSEQCLVGLVKKYDESQQFTRNLLISIDEKNSIIGKG